MENRGRDTLGWYCGALGPDKTGLSRGDFETLQNGAGISWTDVSKVNNFRSGPSANYPGHLSLRDKILNRELPKEGYHFMAFYPNHKNVDRGVSYRTTLFALNRNLEDWAGTWGTNLLPPIRKILTDGRGGLRNLGVLSKFQEMLRGHIIASKQLTFAASY